MPSSERERNANYTYFSDNLFPFQQRAIQYHTGYKKLTKETPKQMESSFSSSKKHDGISIYSCPKWECSTTTNVLQNTLSSKTHTHIPATPKPPSPHILTHTHTSTPFSFNKNECTKELSPFFSHHVAKMNISSGGSLNYFPVGWLFASLSKTFSSFIDSMKLTIENRKSGTKNDGMKKTIS